MKNLILVAVLAFAAPACNVMDKATPQETASIEALREEDTPESNAEADAMERSIAERAVSGFVKWIDPFIPIPLELFTGLAATLVFPRVRRTAIKTIKEAGNVVAGTVPKLLKGDFNSATDALGDFVKSAGSVVGWSDSRNDTADDLAEWAEEIRVSDPTLAQAIDDKLAMMAAPA